MPSPVLRTAKAERARAVRQVEIVDALMARPGVQFNLDELLHRFGSTAKNLTKTLDRAAEGALIRRGRDVAGIRVYWAPTAAEREMESRKPTGDLVGYEAYLYSHWRLAEGVSWERRA